MAKTSNAPPWLEPEKPMNRSFFWESELPALVQTPPQRGLQVLTWIATYPCEQLMRDMLHRMELLRTAGAGFGNAAAVWRKVDFVACRDLQLTPANETAPSDASLTPQPSSDGFEGALWPKPFLKSVADAREFKSKGIDA